MAGRQTYSKPASQICIGGGQHRLSQCSSRQTSCQGNQKHLIQEWLTKQGIQWSTGMLEDELLELCKTYLQEPVYVSRLPLSKDKRTHPGSHAVYNSKALARLQNIEVNYWSSDIARDKMPEHVVIKSGFR